MSFDYSYTLGNALGTEIYRMLNAFPMLLTVAGYILSSLGFYTLAKRRGIRHPWLSWIPVANIWILGSLSDQYSYVVKGQIKSKRKVLLTLKIICTVLGNMVFVFIFGFLFYMLADMLGGISNHYLFDKMYDIILSAGFALMLSMPLIIALAVFRFMALYDVYRSCEPDNAVMFLVFSIIFPFTEPFFVFFSREKEKGMPARKTAYQVPPQADQNSQSHQEPEQNDPQPQQAPQETEQGASDEQAPEYL